MSLFTLEARDFFVPDVRTTCCDAPVRVDPNRPAMVAMVLHLICASCGNDVGSPGPEDLAPDSWWWP